MTRKSRSRQRPGQKPGHGLSPHHGRDHSDDALTLPFSRPIPVAGLSREGETPFRVAAEPEERAALAPYLGVDRVDRLSLAGFIAPEPGGGWRVRGRLVAKIEQSCVVTLEPLPARHEADIERCYLPADRIGTGADVMVSHDEQDSPDPFSDSLDPAALAVESLVLMIDPYPRAEGARLEHHDFSGPGVTPLADLARQPFAALAALKRGGGKGDD